MKKNKKIKTYFPIIFLCLGLFSCIDPINLTLEDEDEFLVIDGSMTTDLNRHPILLYFATGQRTAARRLVEGAQLSLFENGVKLFDYQEFTRGLYILPERFGGTIGTSYQLKITLANGAAYESTPDQIPPAIRGGKVFLELNKKPEVNEFGFSFLRPYIDIFVQTPLPTDREKYWIKWDLTTMYGYPEDQCSPLGPPPEICYIFKPPNAQEINLFNGSNVDSDFLPQVYLAEQRIPGINAEYRNKHYFLVNQKSITESAYNYWRKINQITNQTGSIFDAPPAFIPGNISNINDPEEAVLGFFELSNVDSLRTFITAADIRPFYQFPESVCKPGNPLNLFERACCNCEILPLSTFNRPAWW